MTWRRYLQLKTRHPPFLWRMVFGILAAGVLVGLAVDWSTPAWIDLEGERKETPRGYDGWSQLERSAAKGEWSAVWWGVPRLLVGRWSRAPGLTALAVLTGLSWLMFSLQAAQIRSWRDHRLIAPVAAIGLGVLSIWPTAFFILWQEHSWGLAEGDSLVEGLRYCILGIGLREELAKLVCLLPLLPWLVWRRDELAALVSAGCVGIGFGMEENVGYISGTLGTATLGRLLTAVPAHMTLTGLIGLAAYRAGRWPREWGPQFLATFAAIVLAHGMYDAFLMVPALQEYNLGSFIIFLLLVFQFFRELRPHLTRRGEPVSLTANFLACVSLVAAANFVYLCAAVGFQHAGQILAQGIVAQGIMVYLFLHEMPERLVDV
jgi:RsiW-degrading membrane proteinase PrsW (M82 family)